MASEEQMDSAGEILFEMLSTAMRERGIKMDFASWDLVKGQIKENYMDIVKRIAEALEPPPLYVSDKDKAKEEGLDKQ